ncbi:hypothetical protein ILYODFUR_014576 [Ilyodon furcidens]|uniref:Uncharacterized protein n=1 Tax=Ilyodon furcidens TaxID=33524 RepID=A0ABV0UHI3_9TELE
MRLRSFVLSYLNAHTIVIEASIVYYKPKGPLQFIVNTIQDEVRMKRGRDIPPPDKVYDESLAWNHTRTERKAMREEQ